MPMKKKVNGESVPTKRSVEDKLVEVLSQLSADTQELVATMDQVREYIARLLELEECKMRCGQHGNYNVHNERTRHKGSCSVGDVRHDQ